MPDFEQDMRMRVSLFLPNALAKALDSYEQFLERDYEDMRTRRGITTSTIWPILKPRPPAKRTRPRSKLNKSWRLRADL